MIELNKIDEIANRLRQYELDDKTRYFNIKYMNKRYAEPQLIAERIAGEHEFRRRVNEAINTFGAEKIIIEEFNQKAKSMKEPASTIEIMVEPPSPYPFVNPPATMENQVSVTKGADGGAGQKSQTETIVEAYGGLEGFRQEVRSEVAKEYQLIKEQEEKKQLIDENEKLKKDKKELNDDNTKLYGLNAELSEKIQELQKYIPENLKIGNLSVTKILGSILGTATETMVKSVVMKRPERVKDIIGEAAFEQLSGLVGDDDGDGLDLGLDNGQVQEVQPLSSAAEQKTSENPVVNAINQVNSSLPSGQLAKVQIIYYYLLKDDESLDDEKLGQLIKFIDDNQETAQNTVERDV